MSAETLLRRRALLSAAASASAFAALTATPLAEAAGGRAWLGVELTKAEGGVLAKRVLRGSPAEAAGLKGSDLLLSLDGREVATAGDVIRVVSERGAGATVKVRVRRGKGELTVPVKLVEFPGEEQVLRLDKVGTFAASWKGATPTQGDASDIKKLRGRVVVVEFWASWCGACRAMTPVMNDLHQRFGAQGLTVVGLTDDAEDAALKAVSKLGIKYAVCAGASAETFSDYGVRSLPTFFVVDKRGVFREVFVGAQPGESFEKHITKLLKESAPA